MFVRPRSGRIRNRPGFDVWPRRDLRPHRQWGASDACWDARGHSSRTPRASARSSASGPRTASSSTCGASGAGCSS